MRRLLVCLVAVAVVGSPAGASAATIVVNTTAPSAPSLCGLENAIQAANSNAAIGGCAAGAGADRIEFALPPGSTISLTEALPTVIGNLEIAGPGVSQLAISGNDSVRPLRISGPGNKISGLTIEDGRSNEGGGLLVTSSSQLELRGVLIAENKAVATGGVNAFAAGGGIYSQGDLTLVESTVFENVSEASGASSQNSASGSGVQNGPGGVLVIERSSVIENRATGSSSSAASTNVNGAGIQNFAQMTLIASTISGNTVSAGGSTFFNSSSGAGIANANSPAVKVAIERSTIAQNEAKSASPGNSSGGGLTIYGPSFSISSSTISSNLAGVGANVQVGSGSVNQARSTIIAKPLGGSSCSGTLTSLGYNLEETTGCGFTAATDQSNLNPQLGALAGNGGPTRTMAPAATSPVIDRGISPAGEASDQRGLRRPVDIAQRANAAGGNGADVGAVEYQVPLAEITRGPAPGEIVADAEPTFEFRADVAGASFVCSLDGAVAAPCASPFKAPRLADGAHAFAVTAVSALGLSDATPTSRSFTVDTRVRTEPVKPDVPVVPPKPPPAVRPQSKILGLPKTTVKRRLSIRFSSTVAGSSFQCKLDARKWRSCRSPYGTPQLKLGAHVFKLKAIGPTGLADQTPAVKRFKVLAPRRDGEHAR